MSAHPSPIDPGHAYARTNHISFLFYKQQRSPAPLGYEYYVSLPPTYDDSPSRRWPLLLFLHGAGESQRGPNESYASLRHGVPKIILCYDRLRGGDALPHIDIPQPESRKKNRASADAGDRSSQPVQPKICEIVAEGFITVSPSLDARNGYGWNAKVLSALLDEVKALYRVDDDRVHVTGFSMGGYGTWKQGVETPDRFATLTPVCGGGDSSLAKNIKHVPEWIHHGEKDSIVPISQSEEMYRALQRAGAPEVKFTRYPEAEHDSWTETYGNIEVWRWMLGKTRPITSN